MDQGLPFDYRRLDDVIHSRLRLTVMAILASVDDAEFTWLRDAVGTTDGNLSTHLARLVDAGYLEVTKELVDSRAASRYRLSDEGRSAFADYLTRMEALLGDLEP